jgi:hypothetical protein
MVSSSFFLKKKMLQVAMQDTLMWENAMTQRLMQWSNQEIKKS